MDFLLDAIEPIGGLTMTLLVVWGTTPIEFFCLLAPKDVFWWEPLL